MLGALYRLRRKIVSAFTEACLFCGKPSPNGRALCQSCESLLTVPPAEKLFGIDCAAAHCYVSPAKDVLLAYKFSDKNLFFIEDTLTDWLCEAYRRHYSGREFDFAVPVPSYGKSKTRLSEVVKRFAFMEGLRFAPHLLIKTRRTNKQHEISAAERRTNLVGAFSAENEVRGKRILLIDDIVTTGNTVRECSAALYDRGAKEVAVLSILRTQIE